MPGPLAVVLFLFFELFLLELLDLLAETLVLNFVLEEGVKKGCILGWVGASHHEETAADTGIALLAEGRYVSCEMWVSVRFKDGVGSVEFAEAVEEAEGIAAGDGFVEFANKYATVVWVDEFDDKFAFEVFWRVSSKLL